MPSSLPWRFTLARRCDSPTWPHVVILVPVFALAFGVLFATTPLNRLLAEEAFFCCQNT